jgi:erythromycin esterase-like protein
MTRLQNARIVGAAEEYYRLSFLGGNVTWNIRDRAMVDMIDHALKWHDKKRQEKHASSNSNGQDPPPPPPSKAIVWAHNSHVGDSKATEHHKRRQLNVGRLVRERFGEEGCYIIGFTTNTGTVRAAKAWNGPDYVMELNPGLPNSIELIHHQVHRSLGGKNFGVVMRSNDEEKHPLTDDQKKAKHILGNPLLERFVGVLYVKRTERQSHYSTCLVGKEFDLVIHIDETNALKPLPKKIRDPVRPGTVDYSKWEHLDVPDEEAMMG